MSSYEPPPGRDELRRRILAWPCRTETARINRDALLGLLCGPDRREVSAAASLLPDARAAGELFRIDGAHAAVDPEEEEDGDDDRTEAPDGDGCERHL